MNKKVVIITVLTLAALLFLSLTVKLFHLLEFAVEILAAATLLFLIVLSLRGFSSYSALSFFGALLAFPCSFFGARCSLADSAALASVGFCLGSVIWYIAWRIKLPKWISES